MDKKSTYGMFIFILALIIVLVVLIAGVVNEAKIAMKVEPVTEKQLNCEHEFAVTSQFDFWTRSYRTISKCIKCGFEVK